MNNNPNNFLAIPNFNIDNIETWRWNHRELWNVPIEEAEARHIQKIAQRVGGVGILLATGTIPHILNAVSNPRLPDPQPSIACRTAIFISAQDVLGTSKRQTYHQVNEFLEGFPPNLRVSDEQRILINQTIDSWCTARRLAGKSDFHKLTKVNLFTFFICLLRDRANIDNINHVAPVNANPEGLQEPIQANNVLTIRAGKAYLKTIFEKAVNDNLRANLNTLIGSFQGANAIKTAIQKNLRAKILITGLNHNLTEDIDLIASYIQLAADMVNRENAPQINLEVIEELLKDREGTAALMQAARAGINAEDLALSLHRAQEVNPPLGCGLVNSLATRIAYINLASNLVLDAPEHEIENGVLIRFLNEAIVGNLLRSEQGSIALNLARYYFLNSEGLAKALDLFRTNYDPDTCAQRQAGYIEFLCKILYVWPLRKLHKAFSRDQLNQNNFENNTLINVSPNAFRKTIEFFDRQDVSILLNNFLNDPNPDINEALYRCFDRNYVEPVIIATFIKSATDRKSQETMGNNNQNEILSTNLQAYLNIAATLVRDEENEENRTHLINQFNEFITYAESARSSLYRARSVGITPESIMKLIRAANNNHQHAVENIKLVIDFLQPINQQNQADIRLDPDAVNRYLDLDGSPERMNDHRAGTIPRRIIINTITDVLRTHEDLQQRNQQLNQVNQQLNQAQQQIDAVMQERVNTVLGVPTTAIRIIVLNTYSPEIREQVIARLPEDIRNPILAELDQQNAA